MKKITDFVEPEVQPTEDENIEENVEENSVSESKENTEEEARKLGWVPKEKFKGDESNYIEAETFLNKARTEIPLLKAQIRKMQEDNKQLNEFFAKSLERNRQDLQDKMEKAAEDGDVEQYKRYRKKEEQLQIESKDIMQNRTEPVPQIEPEIEEWVNSNNWFRNDDALKAYATAKYDQIQAEARMKNEIISTRETLRRLDDHMDKQIFRKNVNPKRYQAQAVEGGGNVARRGSTEKSFSSLPPEAKVQCKKWVQQGYMTEKSYLDNYEWDN
jgi:hypothetical protein